MVWHDGAFGVLVKEMRGITVEHDGGSGELAQISIVAAWPKGSFAKNIAIDAKGIIFVTLHEDVSEYVDPVVALPGRHVFRPDGRAAVDDQS